MPPGNFEILDSHRHIFLHFEVYFFFALLLLEVNQYEQIWRKKNSDRFPNNMHYLMTHKKGIISKFNDRKLALSTSSTNSYLFCVDAGEKYANNDHLLAAISIHLKPQFPVDFSLCLAHFFTLF